MSINKCIISKGTFNEQELLLLVSYDENDRPVDLIDLNSTFVGRVYEAVVEKVLDDLDACIVKLPEINEKAFIENKTLVPEQFLLRHSKKNLVCQADCFKVLITEDKKANKPLGGVFYKDNENDKVTTFLDFYLKKYCHNDTKMLTDSEEISKEYPLFSFYNDSEISLWALNNVTGLLEQELTKRFYLKNNANIVIEKTEALTVIDVNTAKTSNTKGFFETNALAAREIARQIRLLNISGIIVIDFLKDMSAKERDNIIEIIKAESAEDFCKVNTFSFSSLGLLEITRTRKLPVLYEIIRF